MPHADLNHNNGRRQVVRNAHHPARTLVTGIGPVDVTQPRVAPGFWAALPKGWPTTGTQRCWVHKTANVLDKMAKRVQPDATGRLHEIWMAPI